MYSIYIIFYRIYRTDVHQQQQSCNGAENSMLRSVFVSHVYYINTFRVCASICKCTTHRQNQASCGGVACAVRRPVILLIMGITIYMYTRNSYIVLHFSLFTCKWGLVCNAQYFVLTAYSRNLHVFRFVSVQPISLSATREHQRPQTAHSRGHSRSSLPATIGQMTCSCVAIGRSGRLLSSSVIFYLHRCRSAEAFVFFYFFF